MCREQEKDALARQEAGRAKAAAARKRKAEEAEQAAKAAQEAAEAKKALKAARKAQRKEDDLQRQRRKRAELREKKKTATKREKRRAADPERGAFCNIKVSGLRSHAWPLRLKLVCQCVPKVSMRRAWEVHQQEDHPSFWDDRTALDLWSRPCARRAGRSTWNPWVLGRFF